MKHDGLTRLYKNHCRHSCSWFIQIGHAINPGIPIMPIEIRKAELLREIFVKRSGYLSAIEFYNFHWYVFDLKYKYRRRDSNFQNLVSKTSTYPVPSLRQKEETERLELSSSGS